MKEKGFVGGTMDESKKERDKNHSWTMGFNSEGSMYILHGNQTFVPGTTRSRVAGSNHHGPSYTVPTHTSTTTEATRYCQACGG